MRCSIVSSLLATCSILAPFANCEKTQQEQQRFEEALRNIHNLFTDDLVSWREYDYFELHLLLTEMKRLIAFKTNISYLRFNHPDKFEQDLDALIETRKLSPEKCTMAAFMELQSLLDNFRSFTKTLIPYLRHNKRRLSRYCDRLDYYEYKPPRLPKINDFPTS